MEERKILTSFDFAYEISESGRLWSVSKKRWMSSYLNNDGYERFEVVSNGKRKRVFAHKMVAAAFIGERPEGMVIDHVDGNKRNNHFSNLEYVSQSENVRRFHALAGRCPTPPG